MGRPSYHPSALLKLYIYGYLNRVGDGVLLEQLELELADLEEDAAAEAAARIAAAPASAAINVAAFERRKGRRIHRRNALE